MYIRWTLAAILLLVAACIFVALVMRIAMSPYIYTSMQDVPKSEVALILGASVVNRHPSPVLALRADAAVALYKSGRVKKIVMTGDNGSLNYDEVTPVRKYLIDAGIPADDIFLDHAGFDTYSSMYRARDVFHVESMTIVTQDFHMPRSLFLARHLGMTAYGFIAPGENTRSYVREIPASLKALLDLTVRRQPKYLGEPILLTGSGTSTWY